MGSYESAARASTHVYLDILAGFEPSARANGRRKIGLEGGIHKTALNNLSMTAKQADPYQTLGLSHAASAVEIKKAYRRLAREHHPDRRIGSADATATEQFAAIADAYALLSDPARKQQYDHIYKYGGFDEEVEETKEADVVSPKKATGVGYTCTDPLAYLWTQGRVHSTTKMAGLQIPGRLSGTGLRFAFSSGEFRRTRSGRQTFTCETTQFCNGKRLTQKETTTIHRDGRKDVVLERDNHVERFTTHHVSRQEAKLPWYMTAWHGVKDSVQMCFAPCAVAAQ